MLLPLLLFLAGCSTRQEFIINAPDPVEDVRESEQPEKTAGSLWQNTGSLFADHKAKNVGDIVTVTISEVSSASKSASTSSDRSSSISAGIPALFGLENNSDITQHDLDLAKILEASFKNDFKGSGKTSRTGTLSASLTTQVIGTYPNGNLKIRGGKEVMVNNEVQVIYLTGIVRSADITAANTIASNKVLNARITYTGQGAVGDKQQPGWLMRVVDNVWPF